MTRETAARDAVAHVVRDMAAARLGRSAYPLVLLMAVGVADAVLSPASPGPGILLAGGALLAGAGLLIYGNGAVDRVRKGSGSPLILVAGLVPLAYALAVLTFRGLRPLVEALAGAAGTPLLPGTVVVLSAWLLGNLYRLMELHRAAGTMSMPSRTEEGP